MRLISQPTPAPRLLSTVVPELRERPPEPTSMRSRLKGASIFSGNGRAIFLGILLGAALLTTAGLLYRQHEEAQRWLEEKRKLVAVSTHSLSPVEPILIQVSAKMIHVSAISLGHPRMAIINGQLVGEGEQITLHIPAASVAVTLRVVRIGEGQIQLTDGTQVITTRLEIPRPSYPKP